LDIASEEEPQSKQTANWLKKTDRSVFYQRQIYLMNLDK
jgi:hypothetical protein